MSQAGMAFRAAVSQVLGLRPKLRAAHSLEPHFELRTVALQWLRQWPAGILAQRVRHAFPEPDGLKQPRTETAKVLVLQMMNELMPDQIRLPPPIADNKGDSRDGICVLRSKAEVPGARFRRAENGTGFGLKLTDTESNVSDGVFVKSRCSRQPGRIIDADLAVAREAGKLRGENSHGFDESPCGDGQCEKSDENDSLKHCIRANLRC